MNKRDRVEKRNNLILNCIDDTYAEYIEMRKNDGEIEVRYVNIEGNCVFIRIDYETGDIIKKNF